MTSPSQPTNEEIAKKITDKYVHDYAVGEDGSDREVYLAGDYEQLHIDIEEALDAKDCLWGEKLAESDKNYSRARDNWAELESKLKAAEEENKILRCGEVADHLQKGQLMNEKISLENKLSVLKSLCEKMAEHIKNASNRCENFLKGLQPPHETSFVANTFFMLDAIKRDCDESLSSWERFKDV